MIKNNTNKVCRFLGFFAVIFLLLAQNSFANLNVKQHFWYLSHRYPELDKKVLESGLTAFEHAEDKHIVQKQILTLVDYSKPSDTKRMWVIDLKSDKVIFRDYVAHASNTGSKYAEHFSNMPGSHQSSIGVYLTDHEYQGSHGLSLRLKGLEKGFNDKAEGRAIVIHGAWYATQKFAEHYGRIGRSWGCFAINNNLINPLINTIKRGSLFVAYYPNPNWLHHSTFLN